MVHSDHVALIRPGLVKNSGGVWADFGSGEGAFTLALRDIVGEKAEIYSIDKDQKSLRIQEQHFNKQFPNTNIHYLSKDFTEKLDLPLLDGAIAANSIHFHKDTISVIKQMLSLIKPEGKLIIVEYNADHGNIWVPYPFSFKTLETIAKETGFSEPKLLSIVPSSFLNEIYAAIIQS